MTITAAQAISALQTRTDRSGACAEYCHEVAVAFGSKTPSVAGPTAYNVAEASNIHNLPVAQAPANSFIWFRQKAGHNIMGYSAPEPGHVMFDPNGGGLDAISITDFAYGPLVGHSKHLRQGSVYTYLQLNPGVEYIGFSSDYAGSEFNAISPTSRQVKPTAPANARSKPVLDPMTIIGNAVPNGVIDMAGYVIQSTPHDPAMVIGTASGTSEWFYSKGGAFFHVEGFVDDGTHDLPDLTAHLFPTPPTPTPLPTPAPAPPTIPAPVPAAPSPVAIDPPPVAPSAPAPAVDPPAVVDPPVTPPPAPTPVAPDPAPASALPPVVPAPTPVPKKAVTTGAWAGLVVIVIAIVTGIVGAFAHWF